MVNRPGTPRVCCCNVLRGEGRHLSGLNGPTKSRREVLVTQKFIELHHANVVLDADLP